MPVTDGVPRLDVLEEPRSMPGLAEGVVALFPELFLLVAGALFSSLKLSINCSMPRSFHSSSGGGRILLAVFVCSLKRDVRGRVVGVSMSLLIVNDNALSSQPQVTFLDRPSDEGNGMLRRLVV